MRALVTILPEPYFQTIMSLWGDLEERFGFRHMYTTPMPHFTWQLGDDYKTGYAAVLEETLQGVSPFVVQTDIITWFSADRPIVYLRVVESEELLSFHRLLWEKLIPWCDNPSMLYSIENWVPHITLSMDERSWLKLPQVRRFLATKDLRWEMKADSVSMVYLTADTKAIVEKQFPFGSASKPGTLAAD